MRRPTRSASICAGSARHRTAPRPRPRVLLIDEIDKSDIDLPNDMLDVFEEGRFEIPELARLAAHHPTFLIRPYDAAAPWPITHGRVNCSAFPIVVMTSNGERGFPGPFLRRCIRLEVSPPDAAKLTRIVESHLGTRAPELLVDFLKRRELGHLATDQLLNAVYLLTGRNEVRSERIPRRPPPLAGGLMLKEFLDQMEQIGIALSPDEVADAIWLRAYLPTADEVKKGERWQGDLLPSPRSFTKPSWLEPIRRMLGRPTRPTQAPLRSGSAAPARLGCPDRPTRWWTPASTRSP